MKKIAVLSLAAFLAACAPTQTGSGAYTPVEGPASLTTAFKVQPGQSIYVSYKVNPQWLGIGEDRFKALGIGFDNIDSAGHVPSTEQQVDWIKLSRAALPTGVQAELVRASLINETDKTSMSGGVTTVAYYRRVRLVVHYTVAASAPLGQKNASMSFLVDGQTKVLPFSLNIAQ